MPSTLTQQGQALTKDEIGLLGEDLACLFLRRRERMKVLYRNFRAPGGGEVDIICRDRDVLVFVEVKTRTSLDFGRPVEAVDEEKVHLISRGAMEWLRMLHFPNILYRFDVVEVILRKGEVPDLVRVQNAFQLPDAYFNPDSGRGRG